MPDNTIMRDKIRFVVVLMLENRSFDNVLGWCYPDEHGKGPQHNIPYQDPPTFDGLVEADYNDPPYAYKVAEGHELPLTYRGQTKLYPIMKGTCGLATNVPTLDPYEEFPHVTHQLFGKERGETEEPPEGKKAEMMGFMQDFVQPYSQDPELQKPVYDVLDRFDELLSKTTLGKLLNFKARPWLEKFLETLGPNELDITFQTWNQTLHVTQTYTPDQLPALNELARNYAVSDRWFCSVPSQTNPNRAFSVCGTSLGREKNSNIQAIEQFDIPNIWTVFDAHGVDWALYYHDTWKDDQCFTQYTFNLSQEDGLIRRILHPPKYIPGNPGRLEKDRHDFRGRALAGELPPFTFLEPRWGFGINDDLPVPRIYQQGNDYHPPNHLGEGEELVKMVYDLLKSNTEAWKDTLLIITFDEHGGTWDHVGPPWGAEPPDKHRGETGFRFNRFGVRVPTILVSPRIETGTVFRSPTDVPYDHTSLIATLLKWKDIDPATSGLGRRVAVAPTFENVLTLDKAREDRPEIRAGENRDARIEIANKTPSPLWVYLGWGPFDKKLPAFLGSLSVGTKWLGRGESVEYPIEQLLSRGLFDYYVAGSYWAGNKTKKDGEWIDPGMYGGGILNKNWRLFWEGWKLILHGQTMTITQGKPYFAGREGDDTYGGQSKITVYNQTPTRLCCHLYDAKTGKEWPWDVYGGYAEHDSSWSYSTGSNLTSWNYLINISYWVGDQEVKNGEVVDTSGIFSTVGAVAGLPTANQWRFLWDKPRPIRHNESFIIRQDHPESLQVRIT